MGWFKRLREGISTATKFKKETPDGLWFQCNKCKETSIFKDFKENYLKCPKCGYHARIGSHDYFDLILDEGYEEILSTYQSLDFLDFTDLVSYEDRIEKAMSKTELNDAISVATGSINGQPITIAAMDFTFIGGSMGSVVGEKIAKAIDFSLEHKEPLLIISKSGGARMMESAFSLMQMAKTSAKLTQLSEAKIPYFSMLTDPTTGGVSASFSMLGDVIFAEPEALIGFAGPRVIKETIKKELPEGFQSSEFLLEHGFLDFIIDRKDLKDTVSDLVAYFT